MVRKIELTDKLLADKVIYMKSISERKLLSKITETTRALILEDALLYYGIVKRNVEFYTERQSFVEWYHSALEQAKMKITDFKDYRDCYYQIMGLLEKDFNYKRMDVHPKKINLQIIDDAQVIDIKRYKK